MLSSYVKNVCLYVHLCRTLSVPILVCVYPHEEEDLSCVVGFSVLHTSLLSDICI